MQPGSAIAHTVPRVAVVGDLCGFGRCSLAAALAVLSALGTQACPLQTAALSTHTGGFGAPARADLTAYLRGALSHWRELGLRFDAVLTGYLSSPEQAEPVLGLLKAQPDALRVVDPVLGDHGRMYASLPEEMPLRMRELCRGASLVTPNCTEACLLAGAPHPEEPLDSAGAIALAQAVRDITGARAVLITGMDTTAGPANVLMSAEGEGELLPFRREAGAYPGTGDLFAAALTGALAHRATLREAVVLAAEFVRRSVAATNAAGTDPREGVRFEQELPMLSAWRRREAGRR